MVAELSGTFGGRVIIDPAKLAEFLRSPNGPAVRVLMEAGQRVKADAQRRVGVYRPPDAYSASHRQRRPGTLRDSIVTRLVADPGPVGVAVLVGSEDPIALWHHEGTQPHLIRARNKPRLVFFWPQVGHVVAFKQVNHPGTKPNRYLTDALAAASFA
jgi:hypothetical protein